MQSKPLVLVVGIALLVVGAATSALLSDEEFQPVRWDPTEEIEVRLPEAEEAMADPLGFDAERTAAEFADEGDRIPVENDARVERILRGRIVDRYGAPVAEATVWLGYSRGGRGRFDRSRRQVPDPVLTDGDGRFAFQGETFRRVRISLQVRHDRFAPGLFDRDIADAGPEIDLGELALGAGGEAIGRVTDLGGNAVPGAEVRLAPQGRSTWRFLRNRDKLLPPLLTDNNGYYRLRHAPTGDWIATATAPRHVEGRSPAFAIATDQQTQVEDIRLGPGYAVTGTVRDERGQSIAGARLSLRAVAPPSGQRGTFSPFGRTRSTKTDEEGSFRIEHLPGTPLRLEVRAKGYLDQIEEKIDPTLERPLQITLFAGLRITGVVLDSADGEPVTRYSVRGRRIGDLPIPGMETPDLGALFRRLRSGDLDPATASRLRAQIDRLRSRRADQGRSRRSGPSESGKRKPERHPDGRFVLSGLREGIYRVTVQSPEHAPYRSEELRLQRGVTTPPLTIRLDGGLFFAGLVLDEDENPIANARVELRTPRAAGQGRDESSFLRRLQQRNATATDRFEARTDAEGEFVFRHVPRGTFELTARADGFAPAERTTIELIGNRSDGRIELGSLGAIAGRVLGMTDPAPAGDPVRVMAMRVNPNGNGRPGRGGMKRGEVAADGTYTIEGLDPGNYVVRAWVGDQRDIMQQLMPAFFRGDIQPDVRVKGGETTDFDLPLTRSQIGSVRGTVLRNGEPAKGFRVEVRREDDGNRGGRMFWRGLRQTTVRDDGSFEIERITAGNSVLVVRAPDRGILYEEPIVIVADTAVDRYIQLTTAALRGTATDESGKPGDFAGRVWLLADATSKPENLRAWRREPGHRSFATALRKGRFVFETVPPGSYLVVLDLRAGSSVALATELSPGDNEISVDIGPNAASGIETTGR